MKDPGLFIRRAGPADAEAIARLVTAAFGGDDSPVGFGPEWWHWKYGSNPAGYRGLVAQDREGRVVGHYGGVPIEVRADGEWLTFGQNCDSCSDPSVRRGLRNPGLFVRLAQAYGARGVRVENQDADRLEVALAEALDSEVPTLIEVPVGEMPYPY